MAQEEEKKDMERAVDDSGISYKKTTKEVENGYSSREENQERQHQPAFSELSDVEKKRRSEEEKEEEELQYHESMEVELLPMEVSISYEPAMQLTNEKERLSRSSSTKITPTVATTQCDDVEQPLDRMTLEKRENEEVIEKRKKVIVMIGIVVASGALLLALSALYLKEFL